MTSASEVEQVAQQLLDLLGVSRQSLKAASSQEVPANQLGSTEQMGSLMRDLLVDFIGMEVHTP